MSKNEDHEDECKNLKYEIGTQTGLLVLMLFMQTILIGFCLLFMYNR